MIQQISSKKTFEKPLSEEKADDTQSGVLGFVISALTGDQVSIVVLTFGLKLKLGIGGYIRSVLVVAGIPPTHPTSLGVYKLGSLQWDLSIELQ